MLSRKFPKIPIKKIIQKSDFKNHTGRFALTLLAGLIMGLGTFTLIRAGYHQWKLNTDPTVAKNPYGITKKMLARAIEGKLQDAAVFPSEVELSVDGSNQKTIFSYSIDSKLQLFIEEQFRQYRPDYGAFVAVDAMTGRVLAMTSYIQENQLKPVAGLPMNLALRATFPSASVFKLVTAAAAIGEKKYTPDTTTPFEGRMHTLYKSHIFRTRENRWTNHMTLRDAFAKSVNTVFGKIGVFTVGPDTLRTYADRFLFNRPIYADFPVQSGHFSITNDPWELAESASGYTRETTMSPLQGAMMAASIVNQGIMMQPFVIQSVHTGDGTRIYLSSPETAGVSVDARTASGVRELMRETVRKGTSRKSFRGFFRGDFSGLDVGGKTGSLTGMDPPGKYDWFVGYADDGKHKIAISALTIHQKQWRVKSSYLARRAIERFFSQAATVAPPSDVRPDEPEDLLEDSPLRPSASPLQTDQKSNLDSQKGANPRESTHSTREISTSHGRGKHRGVYWARNP